MNVPSSPLTRFLLQPLAWGYAVAVALRNKAFDVGILRQTNIGVPVVSVGNITAGGSGKTPLVQYIARHYSGRNKRVAIVSRGYARDSSGVVVVSDGRELLADAASGGDEAVLAARKLPGVVVVVGERRVDAARAAIERAGVEVIILDDGFQHRYIARDLDIVVLHRTRDLKEQALLPAGRLREHWNSLNRAGLVAISHASPGNRTEVQGFSGTPVSYRYKLTGYRQVVRDEAKSPESFRGTRALAFSGIGHNEDFFNQLSESGVLVERRIPFPDHYAYSSADIRMISEKMRQARVDCCITTEKDAVRLLSPALAPLIDAMPVYAAEIAADFVEGKEMFDSMLDAVCDGRSR